MWRNAGYAGEISQAATKAKNDKRFEGRNCSWYWKIYPRNPSKGLSKEAQNMCGPY